MFTPVQQQQKQTQTLGHNNEERERGEADHSQQMQTPKMILTERPGERLSEAYPLN